MKREDKWGEDTSRSRKMGGVYAKVQDLVYSVMSYREKNHICHNRGPNFKN